MQIRDRIKDLRRVKASELLPNPRNWRTHPNAQADALRGVLAEVGWADAVLARETKQGLQLIDGHLRAEVGAEAIIPVLVVDVTEDEANLLLASHDPLAAMAETDGGKLSALLADLEPQAEAVKELFEKLTEQNGVFDVESDEFPSLPAGDRDTLETMSFTLTTQQANVVKEALRLAKEQGPFVDTGNNNSNGNALERICEGFCGAS